MTGKFYVPMTCSNAQNVHHVIVSRRSTSQDLCQSSSLLRTRLYLVIYAPKREVVEVWPMRVGKKVRTFRCGSNCALLQPSPRAEVPKRGSDDGIAPLTTCYLLNGSTGEIWDVADRLAS
jgi:hypothetical protein